MLRFHLAIMNNKRAKWVIMSPFDWWRFQSSFVHIKQNTAIASEQSSPNRNILGQTTASTYIKWSPTFHFQCDAFSEFIVTNSVRFMVSFRKEWSNFRFGWTIETPQWRSLKVEPYNSLATYLKPSMCLQAQNNTQIWCI